MEYRFTIADSFTPETLPLLRLAEYAAALARLLGEQASVHLLGVEAGSAVLVAGIDPPARMTVRDRIAGVRNANGPDDARKAYAELDEMLRKDAATGTLSDGTAGGVLAFPGRRRPEPVVFGPFREDGTIDGQVIRVGGRDETVPVHLRDGETVHTGLFCTPELARRIAQHLYGPTLRVHGTGTWIRTGTGAWELQRFRIGDFEVLDDSPLLAVVDDLRGVKGSDWNKVADPMGELLADRHGDEGRR